MLDFMVVFCDENNDVHPDRGELLWNEKQLDANQLTRDELRNVFGDGYWMDTDKSESIAFYEYLNQEMCWAKLVTNASPDTVRLKTRCDCFGLY
jgi:hypothetical protein